VTVDTTSDDNGAALLSGVRPFLDRGRSLGRVPEPDPFDPTLQGVRAFAMTKGRAHAAVHLAFETMLQCTAAGLSSRMAMRFERAEILQRCTESPLSVAELSAALHVPIGVVRVVAADLLAEGLLQAFHPSETVADDVFLLTRLIAGVRAL